MIIYFRMQCIMGCLQYHLQNKNHDLLNATVMSMMVLNRSRHSGIYLIPSVLICDQVHIIVLILSGFDGYIPQMRYEFLLLYDWHYLCISYVNVMCNIWKSYEGWLN